MAVMFEKVISARLTCELEYKGFDEQQFAYLKHRSSTQAVLTLVEMIRVNLLKQNTVGALFFDFTDAFGSVNRTKLVYRRILTSQVGCFCTLSVFCQVAEHGSL